MDRKTINLHGVNAEHIALAGRRESRLVRFSDRPRVVTMGANEWRAIDNLIERYPVCCDSFVAPRVLVWAHRRAARDFAATLDEMIKPSFVQYARWAWLRRVVGSSVDRAN